MFIGIELSVSTFKDKYFECENGVTIYESDKCNSKKDCSDGSDETFEQCYKHTCPEEKCSYGGCINSSQLCDGTPDCWDESDEHIRKCSPEWKDYRPDNTGCK